MYGNAYIDALAIPKHMSKIRYKVKDELGLLNRHQDCTYINAAHDIPTNEIDDILYLRFVGHKITVDHEKRVVDIRGFVGGPEKVIAPLSL